MATPSPLVSALFLWLLPVWGALLILLGAVLCRGLARFLVLALGPALLFAAMQLASDAAFYDGNLLAGLIYLCGWIAIGWYYPLFALGAIAYALYRFFRRRNAVDEDPAPNLRDF